MLRRVRTVLFFSFIVLLSLATAKAADITRELKIAAGQKVEIRNRFGRVGVRSIKTVDGAEAKLTATSPDGLVESEVTVSGGVIKVSAKGIAKRIDVLIELPERTKLVIETGEGAIDVSGNFASLAASTSTGTIAIDIPDEDVKYQLLWTESHPRYVADFELKDIKELSGGRFEIKGHYGEADRSKKKKKEPKPKAENEDDEAAPTAAVPKFTSVELTTARGIILINVPPSEVMSDLRERPLTQAAKAIVRSGDALLMEAIRRAAPKYYGDYARSLPPIEHAPHLTQKADPLASAPAALKTAVVRITDLKNRSIAGLGPRDFEVLESGIKRDVVSVERSTAPFNLVLLLDVSGSVENYVNFIRKAARSFIDTVDKRDRVAIVIFNEDVKLLAKFTTDKGELSESLDTFDAGGGTAFYDALGYTLSDTIRPLRGDRTAIVILTDGDDNRSFLSFEALVGPIQESGALIYPLYVPSTLIAASSAADIDPLRKKYMSLSAKSEGEGARLAQLSGGVYYPISQLSEIQKAYNDIVLQLRSAYKVTFRSDPTLQMDPRHLKIRAKKENTFSVVSSVTPAQ
jgi:VWFA-related protein